MDENDSAAVFGEEWTRERLNSHSRQWSVTDITDDDHLTTVTLTHESADATCQLKHHHQRDGLAYEGVLETPDGELRTEADWDTQLLQKVGPAMRAYTLGAEYSDQE